MPDWPPISRWLIKSTVERRYARPFIVLLSLFSATGALIRLSAQDSPAVTVEPAPATTENIASPAAEIQTAPPHAAGDTYVPEAPTVVDTSPGAASFNDTATHDVSVPGVPSPVTASPVPDLPPTVSKTSWLTSLTPSTLPVHFGLSLVGSYNDNIFLQPFKVYDYITSISPSVAYVQGEPDNPHSNFLSIAYQPSFVFYDQNSYLNNIGQNFNLQYAYTFTRLTLSFSQGYTKSNQATADANNIVDLVSYNTSVGANYVYSEKLTLHSTITQNITNYSSGGRSNVNQWTVNNYFLYALTDKLKVGAGPVFGFVDQQNAENQIFEQLLGHIEYQATGRITLKASGGVSDRQYQGNTPNQITPVLNLSCEYVATETTILRLSARADTYSSADLQGQTFTEASAQVGISQRFFQKFFASAGVGISRNTYTPISRNSNNTGPDRQDDYLAMNGGLQWQPNEWLSVGFTYSYAKDDSNYNFATFENNIYTMQISGKY